MKQIFDVTLVKKFFHSYEMTNKMPSDMYVLISKDAEKMNLLYNNYWTFDATLEFYNKMLKEHLEYLANFMNFLKRKYEIE